MIVIGLLIVRNNKINIANPLFVYSSIWGVMALTVFFHVFSKFTKINNEFIIMMGISYLMFLIGSMMFKKIKMKPKKNIYNFNKMYLSGIILFVIIMISFIITWYIIGPPPLLGGNVNRVDYYIGAVEMFFLFIFPLWYVCLFQISNGFKVKQNMILVFFSLMIVILKGNKFPIIIFLLYVAFFIQIYKKIKVKHILIGVTSVLLVFYLSSSLYGANSQLMGYKANITGFTFQKGSYILLDPLLYLSNNIYNLNRFLQSGFHQYTMGFSGLEGIMKVLHIDSISLDSVMNGEQYWKANLQYSWLTTGTYLKSAYIDFGILGLFAIPFLLGSISTVYYTEVKNNNDAKNNNLTRLFIYINLFVFLCLSFFTNYFSKTEIVPNIIIIFIIDMYSKTKGVRNDT
ncbi:O-antigen polymerase [Dellaglioa carnosa]|uniref:Oligosaccharide repeat unit polymerase n=1 Tax=Dellaglioa carnosa TaxID=2995136 RepID=A0ABT4JMK5_9LACO|nr:O-antigen polymerase [Dellaglioa carnosa]MCZ2491590.1 oligosaccharide repeat unit polymerase [Dellaglioa carnosa]MCZ2494667.1 oligosaccharide repeat unit polymerase [Dellaglioa carnosa]MDK1731530.1 oligosaccharide repeat unit polymerase [Dellaglioa carnosa]